MKDNLRNLGLVALVTLASPGVKDASAEAQEIFQGNTERAEMALTLDCGPWVNEGYLIEMLNAADEYTTDEYKVDYTVFVTGEFIEKHQELFETRIKGRHHIANHTFSHLDHTKYSEEVLREQLKWTEESANRFGVSTKPFWRPPFGARNDRLLQVAEEEGYKSVMWSVDSGDWTTIDAEAVQKRILNGSYNGSVIVAHCNSWQTAAVIRNVLKTLKAWGMKVTTVPDLLR